MQEGQGTTQETEPAVSVVVPTFNRLDILPRCLSALACQTHASYEVLVVDDGSDDDTVAFLEEFAAQHPDLQLRWMVNERNRGANASRNRAIGEARGQMIAFLDSDCIAEPDWLEKLTSAAGGDGVAGATGSVIDPPVGNIYELVIKGTHRVHGDKTAPRLLGGNMCLRADLLREHPLDEDLRYGCDEEGVYLRLNAAGYEARLAPEAVVLHEHHYTRRSFFRQAWVGGAAAAWLVYKYCLPPRLDLLPFVLAYLLLPLGLLDVRLSGAAAFFLVMACAALLYNERLRKRKTAGEIVRCFPVLLAYYHVRLLSYVVATIRLHILPNRIERVDLKLIPRGDAA